MSSTEQPAFSSLETSRAATEKCQSEAAISTELNDICSQKQLPAQRMSEPFTSTVQPSSGDSAHEQKRCLLSETAQSIESAQISEPPASDNRIFLFRFFDLPLPVLCVAYSKFFERVSYYGIVAILVLYLKTRSPTGLGLDDGTATVTYHTFAMLGYCTPLLGGIVADSCFGKFWTIALLSVVYTIGTLVLAATAFPLPAFAAGALVGLLLIALGSGGVKPCVSAFGADQFGSSPREQRQMSRFFAVLYFNTNLASLFSYIIWPILRTNVKCFNSDNCYPLVFGVSSSLLFISTILFIGGYSLYKRNPPKGNVLVKVVGIIFRALMNWCRKKSGVKRGFLSRASDKYDEQFIDDVRTVLRVLLLFLPVPVFWALYEQQGSRWTLQANQMDFGFVQPDNVRVLNPLLVLVLIPLFDSVIYPLFARCDLLTNKRLPQRMVVGGMLAAGAFFAAALVQIAIDLTQPKQIASGKIRLLTGNLLPNFTLSNQNNTSNAGVPFMGTIDEEIDMTLRQLKFRLSSDTANTSSTISSTINLLEIGTLGKSTNDLPVHSDLNVNLTIGLPDKLFNKSRPYRLVISRACRPLCYLYAKIFAVVTEKADNGNSYVRVVSLREETVEEGNFTVQMVYAGTDVLATRGSFNLSGEVLASSELHAIERNWLNLKLKNSSVEPIIAAYNEAFQILNGAGLTVVFGGPLGSRRLQVDVLEDIPANTVSIFLQVPQYVLITLGEVLFMISGLEFAYQHAPSSLKSFVSACWLLTTAIGNLMIVAIAELRIHNRALEFVLFAVFMLLDIIVFAVIAFFFKSKEETGPSNFKVEAPAGLTGPALEIAGSPKEGSITISSDSAGYVAQSGQNQTNLN